MKKINAVAFDLDGTIYTGEKLVDGAAEIITYLKDKNIKICYFTNNSGKTRKDIHKKLLKLGLNLEIGTVYNSSYAAGVYLKNNHFKKVYCCGSPGLQEELAFTGIKCVRDNEAPEAVVVGLDLEFNYKKMAVALNLLRNRDCQFIVCNKDRNYPIEDYRLMPGCGTIVAALEFAADRQVDVIIGKPETFMLDLLCKDWNLRSEEILVVGDTFDSDIAMADSYGSPSLLIGHIHEASSIARTIRSIIEIKNYL